MCIGRVKTWPKYFMDSNKQYLECLEHLLITGVLWFDDWIMSLRNLQASTTVLRYYGNGNKFIEEQIKELKDTIDTEQSRLEVFEIKEKAPVTDSIYHLSPEIDTCMEKLNSANNGVQRVRVQRDAGKTWLFQKRQQLLQTVERVYVNITA